jgi:hypothetical protein
VSASNLCINPARTHPLPFHPTDFIYAGLTEDLDEMLESNLQDSETASWFMNNEMPIHSTFRGLVPRYTNEQYIIIDFLNRKQLDPMIRNAFDNRPEVLALSEAVIGAIFFMKSTKNLGINNQKYPIRLLSNRNHSYTEKECECLMKRGRSEGDFLFDLERLTYRAIFELKKLARRDLR